jgi:SWI/SNF-related matrix-associated actin-dependent regulator 1 of chromatin subfamily A
MFDVYCDGDFFNIRLNKKNHKTVLDIAEGAESFEYVEAAGTVMLPAVKKTARKLYKAGLRFDSSMDPFIEGLIPAQGPVLDLPKHLALYPFQAAGVYWMADNNRNFLLGDSPGLGKTIQIAAYLRLSQSFPALIICPASLKLNWEREIKKWTDKKSLILEGLQPYEIAGLLEEFPVIIINYDILGRKDKEEVAEEEARVAKAKQAGIPFRRRRVVPNGWIDILRGISFKNIICDESQFIGEASTARTSAVVDLCRSVKSARRIFLSGTPYTSNVKQFFTTLNLIAPKTFPNRWRFQMRYCDPFKNRYGWEFNGLSNAGELHDLIGGFMLRRLKQDVLEELPAKITAAVPMELDKAAYKEYLHWEDTVLSGSLRDIEACYQALRMAAYRAKRDSCIAWVKDYLAVNDKLVIFVYHRESFDYFMKKFSKVCVGINGATPVNLRQRIVDLFQNDSKKTLFIGQIRAAGVGITLTAASAAAFIEFGNTPSDHEQAEDRIHRISQKADSILVYYLTAPDTLDDDIMERLSKKYRDQKQVLDGVKGAQFVPEDASAFMKGALLSRKEKRGL